MLKRAQFASLLPHQGQMNLLDLILSWDAHTLHAQTQTHLDVDNPLRMGGQLSSLHVVEYSAQAAAIHGGLLSNAAGMEPMQGLLAAVRTINLYVERLDQLDAPMQILIQQLFAQGANRIYTFRVNTDNQPIADGQISIMSGTTPSQDLN